jgi:hypothetical protein
MKKMLMSLALSLCTMSVVACPSPAPVDGEGEGEGEEGEGEGEGEGEEGEGEGEGEVGEGEGEGEPGACLFAPTLNEIIRQQDLVTLSDVRVTTVTAMSPTERGQFLEAVRFVDPSVTTADQAINSVDENEVRIVQLWDKSRTTRYILVVFGRGDTALGAVYAAGSMTAVARINDTDVVACTATRGDAGGACDDDNDCGADVCQGVVYDEGIAVVRVPGTCVPVLSGVATGDACISENDCSARSTALTCVGVGASGGVGSCEFAWNVGDEDDAALRDAPLTINPEVTRTLTLSGLARVDAAVSISMWVVGEVADLTITLTNPVGTQATINPGAGTELSLTNTAVDGFGGGEPANGDWQLRITDNDDSNAPSQLLSWSLRVASRPN